MNLLGWRRRTTLNGTGRSVLVFVPFGHLVMWFTRDLPWAEHLPSPWQFRATKDGWKARWDTRWFNIKAQWHGRRKAGGWITD